MVTEPSSSVKYTVLVQAFNQSKKALHVARVNKKVAKEAREKGESEDISKMERHVLIFDFKREKHRFKAKKAKLKLIREQLRLWFKANPNETTPEMLRQVNERIKNLQKVEGDVLQLPKNKKEKVKKIKKDRLLEIDKEKKVKQNKHNDVVKFVKVKHKIDVEATKEKKSYRDKKSLKEFSLASKPKILKTEEQTNEVVQHSKLKNKPSLPNFSIETTSLETKNERPTQTDLTIIEGIGPKVQQVLNSHNIFTFSDIVQSSVDSMRQILKAHKLYIINPSTWAEQAQLVIENKMDELKVLQLALKNGKRI